MTIVAVFVLGLAIGAVAQMGWRNFAREVLGAATGEGSPYAAGVEVDERG